MSIFTSFEHWLQGEKEVAATGLLSVGRSGIAAMSKRVLSNYLCKMVMSMSETFKKIDLKLKELKQGSVDENAQKIITSQTE